MDGPPLDEPSPIKIGYYYDRKTGAIGSPNLYRGERHVLLFGLNGAGKSTRFLVENLMTVRNCSLVVFDVKGELAAQTAPQRRKFGDVKIINPFGLLTDTYPDLGSDGYNPLALLDPADDHFYEYGADIGAAMIETEGDTQPHFPDSARGLVVAGCLYEAMVAARERRTPSLFNVRQMLTEPDEWGPPGPDGRQHLVRGLRVNAERMVSEGGPIVASLAGRFLREHGQNELAGIQSTAATQTEWLLSRQMRADLEKDGVNFRQLSERPTTVYVILPAQYVTHFRRWTRLVITAALCEQFRPGRVKTLFILDEFYAALGHLKIVHDVWSLVRGFGIRLLPVVQSATQLKALFRDEWENFAAQAGAVITIGPPNDLMTAKWMSERSGTDTIVQKSWSSGGSDNFQQGMTTNEGMNYQQIERPFLLPQELMSMEIGTGRIWTPGEGTKSIPFFAPNFWKDRRLRGIVRANPYYDGAAPAGGDAMLQFVAGGSDDARRVGRVVSGVIAALGLAALLASLLVAG